MIMVLLLLLLLERARLLGLQHILELLDFTPTVRAVQQELDAELKGFCAVPLCLLLLITWFVTQLQLIVAKLLQEQLLIQQIQALEKIKRVGRSKQQGVFGM
jgi:hypothetical protein